MGKKPQNHCTNEFANKPRCVYCGSMNDFGDPSLLKPNISYAHGKCVRLNRRAARIDEIKNQANSRYIAVDS